MQAHSTSAGYIAGTAGFHGVPSFLRTITIILPNLIRNVNLDSIQKGV